MSPFSGLAFGCSCFVLFRVAAGAEPSTADCAVTLGCSAGRNPRPLRWLPLSLHGWRRAEDPPLRPTETPTCWWHRRSCSSCIRPDLAPPTSRENFRPSAPTPQNAAAAADTASARKGDKIIDVRQGFGLTFRHPNASLCPNSFGACQSFKIEVRGSLQ